MVQIDSLNSQSYESDENSNNGVFANLIAIAVYYFYATVG